MPPLRIESEREARVGDLYRQGFTQSAIANRLGVDVFTVAAHVAHLEQRGVIKKRSRSRSTVIRNRQTTIR